MSNLIAIHIWDILSVIVLLIIGIILIAHTIRQKNRDKGYEEARKQKLDSLKGASEDASDND